MSEYMKYRRESLQPEIIYHPEGPTDAVLFVNGEKFREYLDGKISLEEWPLFVESYRQGKMICKFKKGDIVKTINGIDVQHYDGIIAIRKLLREQAGTTYTFEIVRENERIEKRLILQDLY